MQKQTTNNQPAEPLEVVLGALKSRGVRVMKSGTRYTCRCPAHDDRNPSLSFGAGDDGRVLIKCFAGCTLDAVCGALGLSSSDLFPAESNTDRPKRSRSRSHTGPSFASADDAVRSLIDRLGYPSASWDYHDEQNELVGVVVRFETEAGKECRPVSLDRDRGRWVLGAMPSPRPLYGLGELRTLDKGSTVYVCEGEKAADAARSLGLNATTSVGGSNAPHFANWHPLAQMPVVVIPDHDEAGEKYASAVTRQLQEVGAESVRIVRLTSLDPALPESGDIADLVDKGEDLDALREQLEAFVQATPVAKIESGQPAQPTMDTASHNKPATAELLVGLALENYTHGCSETGEPYAVSNQRPCIASLLERSLKKELASKFRSSYGRVPPSTALANALVVLDGKALDEPVTAFSIRAARLF